MRGAFLWPGWHLPAAVGGVKPLRVGAEGIQAEFGAKVNRPSLVFGAVIAFQRGSHDAVTDRFGYCCNCFEGIILVFRIHHRSPGLAVSRN